MLFAIVLLTTTVSFLLPLLHHSFIYARQTNEASLGASIASSKLHEFRAWASQHPEAFGANGWRDYLSTPSPDPDHPEFSVRVRAILQSLYSPCGAFEQLRPAVDRRTLEHSTLKVQVDVDWGLGPEKRLRLLSLLSAPTRRLDQVEITSIPTTPCSLAVNSTVNATAIGRDSLGQEIPDLFFSWSCKAITGSGKIQSTTRDGRQALFQNQSRSRRGKEMHTGGTCQIQVQSTCRGREVIGYSREITLEKP